jgi:hypothetical protein
VLEAVPDRDVAERHLLGHARENFPVIVLGHDFLPLSYDFLPLAIDSGFIPMQRLRHQRVESQGVKNHKGILPER